MRLACTRGGSRSPVIQKMFFAKKRYTLITLSWHEFDLHSSGNVRRNGRRKTDTGSVRDSGDNIVRTDPSWVSYLGEGEPDTIFHGGP